jgi:hypothetical protein
MAWKPIAEQFVIARLDGKVREVLVTAWNSNTGAVKVDWPPQIPANVFPGRLSHVGRTNLEKASYEPLDPAAFMAATRGHQGRSW